MPRLSPEVREARRLQIAEATLRCLGRNGLAGTSMADIIEESGLSAGSIYSHFDSKADVVRFAAATMVEARRGMLLDATDSPGPRQVGLLLITRMLPAELVPAMLQIWVEASLDDELRAVVADQLGTVRRVLAETLLPWATGVAGSADEAEALAGARADTVLALTQGYLVRRALAHPGHGETETGRLLENVLSTLED